MILISRRKYDLLWELLFMIHSHLKRDTVLFNFILQHDTESTTVETRVQCTKYCRADMYKRLPKLHVAPELEQLYISLHRR